MVEESDVTYAQLLGRMTEFEYRELTHRKLDCIMQGIEYLWNQRDGNAVDPKLQIPVYPQPNVIIYQVPSQSGHPPFYADSEYVAEGWPWPDVPPKPVEEAS